MKEKIRVSVLLCVKNGETLLFRFVTHCYSNIIIFQK